MDDETRSIVWNSHIEATTVDGWLYIVFRPTMGDDGVTRDQLFANCVTEGLGEPEYGTDERGRFVRFMLKPILPEGAQQWQPRPLDAGAADDGLLTALEHKAIEALAESANLIAQVIDRGNMMIGDVGEMVAHIHPLQHMVMAQAAARAYPNRYRLLGAHVLRGEPE